MVDERDKTEVIAQRAIALQPKKLGRYTIERLLAEGGMAEVYVAKVDGPAGFEKRVVVKRIRPALLKNKRHARVVDMFLREARLLASLDHRNIVQIFEFGEDAGEYFLAMEHLEGLTLRDLADRFWRAGRPLPIEVIVSCVADAALGLEHTHNARDKTGQGSQLVHRDVSPDNLFLTRAGVTKLLDFGIAKRIGGDALTRAGEIKGKIPYMSPEQLRGGDIDGRSDLFSLGVVLYWLLCGRRPFDGPSDIHTMKSIVSDPPVRPRAHNPHIPAILEEVVMSCLQKNPAERVQSGAALHDALMTPLVGLPMGAPTPSAVLERALLLPGGELEVQPRVAAMPSVSWSGGALEDAPTGLVAALSSSSDRSLEAIGSDTSEAPDTTAPKRPRAGLSSTPPPPPPAPQRARATPQPATDVAPPYPPAPPPATDPPAPPSVEAPLAPLDFFPDAQEPEEPVPEPEPRSAEESFPFGAPTQLRGPFETGGDGPTERVRVHELTTGEEAGQSTSLVLPAALGTLMAACVVVFVGWLSGSLERVAPSLPRSPLLSAQGEDAGPFDEVDAVAPEVPEVPVAAPVVVLVAADAGAGVADAGAVALVDAGADAALGEEGSEALADDDDGGDEAVVLEAEEVVDAGAGVAVVRRPAMMRVRARAPSSVSWQTVGGKALGSGARVLRLSPGTSAVVAIDNRRGTRLRVPVEGKSLNYSAQLSGRLTVRARPFADVYLGKEKIGTTPLTDVPVAPVRQVVRLEWEGKSKTVPIDPRPGKPAVVQIDMRK